MSVSNVPGREEKRNRGTRTASIGEYAPAKIIRRN